MRRHLRQATALAVLALSVFDSVCLADDESKPAASNPEVASFNFNLARWLDLKFEQQWSAAGVNPQLCDDATFLRRVSLDVVGRIPSVAMTRDFLADSNPQKREQLVDRLIADPENSAQNNELYAEHLAAIWRRILVPPGSGNSNISQAIDPWFQQQFRENTPYDQIVHQLLTAEGDESVAPAMVYQAVGGNAESYADTFSRVFLGVRIGCAQCHDHPFAAWKQEDFWGMAAFFSATSMAQANNSPLPGVGSGGLQEAAGPIRASFEGQTFAPKLLWSHDSTDIDADQRPREVLSEWLISEENPNFAPTAVNRIWQYLLGEGAVREVDNLDLISSEEREQILDPLARQFIASGYDLRWLISGICKSKAYQCVSLAGKDDPSTLTDGRRPLKTLTPQQVFDSLEQALMLPVTRSDERSARHNGRMSQLVQRLDESINTSPTEYSAGVPQVLLLMNGAVTAEATQVDRSQTLRAIVEAPFLEADEKLEALYLATLTRQPSTIEQEKLRQHLAGQPDESSRKRAYGEILWALINSPEFVLCR